MSGAELRIIAELANATSWLMAFAKGHDVHSVSTEILEPEKWKALACVGGEKHFDKEKDKEVILPPCAYYALDDKGEPARLKCKCPGHVELRQNTKAVNFLLCYGGGPSALADDLGITIDAAKALMRLHEARFPDVWAYLEQSGRLAKQTGEARDMYGRRRSFPEPTRQAAKDWFEEEHEEDLELDEETCKLNLFNFKAKNLREPSKEEEQKLTHRSPTEREIGRGFYALSGSIERRGKNHCIQGTNASIIKRAMGCGIDKNGIPFLWHTLPQYKAKVQNMVHDELVIGCPKRFGPAVLALIGDAFKRAAAEVMHKVIMEFDGHISNRWMK
jgi:DNA polymerase I-like protein with 3'-5' exonuclease and polymerase domains